MPLFRFVVVRRCTEMLKKELTIWFCLIRLISLGLTKVPLGFIFSRVLKQILIGSQF